MSDTTTAQTSSPQSVQQQPAGQSPPMPSTLGAPVQTSYPSSIPIGLPGMPATMVGWDADTAVVETAAGIAFARAVSTGATQRRVVVGGAVFRGVTYRDITIVSPAPEGNAYPQYANCGVCRRGDIWVDAKEAVLVTDRVAYDPATGQLGKTGTFISGQWMRNSVSSGGVTHLALLRLEFPGYAPAT